MSRVSQCPVCTQPTDDARVAFRAARGTETDTIVQCQHCAHAFLQPMPSAETIASFYGSDYHCFTTSPDDPGRIDALIAELHKGDRYNHVSIIPGGRYLDIGCSTGDMVMAMNRLGMESEGVEVSAFAAAKARDAGLNVFTGTLEAAGLPDDSFDCASMFHVLEHVPDALALLQECRRILKPGGELVVGVPNFQSLIFAIVGKTWVGLQLPTHLHHFTVASLGELARRAGFEVPAITTESLPRHVEIELVNHARQRYFLPGRLFHWTHALKGVSRRLALKGEATDRGESIVAHLRKPDRAS